MKKEIKKIIFLGITLLPSLVFAVGPTLAELVNNFGNIINMFAKLLIAVAVLYLIWNTMEYVRTGSGDPKKAAEAGMMITYSIIALFVMISVWGLVAIIQNTFGLDNTIPNLPTVN